MKLWENQGQKDTNAGIDSEFANLLALEEKRQTSQISLIASENHASPAVRQAMASVLAGKYAEGYPGRRYYAGCEVVDQIEQLAIDRCRQLFGAEHANVQPHSGSQANFAVYYAFLNPGDPVMGMNLAAGGHLTHGYPVNLSGQLYRFVQYGVDRETELLDYDAIASQASECRPKMIVVGASAYSRTINFERCAEIAKEVGAILVADIAHIAGLVAAGLHPSPVGYADVITATTHKTLRGPRGGFILCNAEHAEKIDRAVMPGTQGGPHMHAIAAKTVCFYEALQPEFKTYQQQVVANACAMADEFQQLDYRVVSGGTDNHLFILDLRGKGLTGLEAEQVLEKAGITVSRSCIPFDTQKPWIGSGIRIGTPVITTRGMDEVAARELARILDAILCAADIQDCKRQVAALCKQHPLQF